MAKAGCIVLPPDRDPKVLGIFTRERGFYRTFFPLLAVIMLQQVAALAVNMVDNLMLGTYTELALSGATLVNQIQFTLQQVASGTGMGIVVLASQYWGQRRTEPIRRIISLGVKLGLAVGLLFFAAARVAPHGILSVFTNDEAVIAEGMRYLRIISWTYIIFAVSNSLMYSLQSVETAAVGTVMSCATICINFCLNYCLIYGNFGFPELGVEGAAWATLASRIVELAIITVYVLRIDKKLSMRLRDLLTFDTGYLRDYLRTASPIAISGFLWGVAQAAQTAVLGHISASAIAANSIASVVFQIFVVVATAGSNAASVVIGKTVGAGRLDMVRSYSKTLQGIFLLMGLVSGALLFALKEPIVGLYSVSDETRALALQFLTVQSITTAASCYQMPVMCGIIAGGGSTKYPALIDNLFMWLLTIPSAVLSAFVFGFPPVVTFCCLKAEQFLKAIPNAIVCARYRWVKVLTK